MLKKIVLIDDDELFRTGLMRLIDSFDNYEVVISSSTEEFLINESDINKSDNDLVILNPPQPVSKGVVICEKVVQFFSSSRVMIFTNSFSKFSVIKAIELGISAYFTKTISPFKLEELMGEITDKKDFADIKLEPKVRNVIVSEAISNITFSEAEEMVLKLVCAQKSNTEISEELGISIRTVESRKRNMIIKTQSKNIIGVVLLYMKNLNLRED